MRAAITHGISVRRFSYSSGWNEPLPESMAAFREWTQRHAAARTTAARDELEREGLALARTRRITMRGLIRADPARALAVTVPAAVRENLPPAVLAELETRVAGVGDLKYLCAIPAPGSAANNATRRTISLGGRDYGVHAYGRRAAQQTELGASLHGIALDGDVALHEAPLRVLEPDETPATNATIETRSPVTGEAIAPERAALLVEMHGRIWPLADAKQLAQLERRLVSAEDLPGPNVPVVSAQVSVPAPDIQPLAPTSWTTGTKRLLILRVDFSDLPGEAISASAAGEVFNATASYFSQSSCGLTSLLGSVSPALHRMPKTAAYYATSDLLDQLQADALVAAASDFNAQDYTNVAVIFRRVTDAGSRWTGWSGLGEIGGTHSFFQGSFDFRLLAHELGHNYGLPHADLWQVSDGNPVSAAGSAVDYGDPFDVMGSGGASFLDHFGPWFKNRLGWLSDSAVRRVTASGTHRIYAFNQAGSAAQQPLALNIFCDGTRSYWVGVRAEGSELSGAAFVQWGFNSSQESLLLDMRTPGVAAGDADIAVGDTFVDAVHGITIRPIRKGGREEQAYVDLEVAFAPPAGALVAAWGDSQATDVPVGLRDVVAIAAGARHALALKSGGTVAAWGASGSGQTSVPGGLSGVVAIAAGGDTSGVVKSDGTVVMWGRNASGQATVPAGLGNVKSLAIGQTHTLALKNDGSVVAWGSNSEGQGNVPADLKKVIAIAAGEERSFAVRSDGSVVAWGDDDVPSAAKSGVVAIAAAGEHVLALKSDGTVVAWGEDDSDEEEKPPAGLRDVVAISCGEANCAAVKSDGTVIVWGRDDTGQRNVPRLLPRATAVGAGGGFMLALVRPTVAAPPTILAQPSSQSVAAGNAATFSVSAGGSGPLNYQWFVNAVPIAGATSASYTIPFVQDWDAGAYSVLVSSAESSITSNATFLVVNPPPAATGRLLNLSARAAVPSAGDTIIPGFVIAGSGTKRVLVRAVGPRLAQAPFLIGNTMTNPQLVLKRSLGNGAFADIAANDDWGTNANAAALIATTAQLGGFDLGAGSADAALLVDLTPGTYTVVASGAGGGTGVAIVELYDADASTPTADFVNISNRGYVGRGEQIMIPGFVVSNESARTFLIRAVGPTLGLPPFNVPGVLADPRLTVYRGADGVLSNDDWGASPTASDAGQTAARVGAFALPAGSKDAAFVVTLPPGAYTVQASGAGDSTGVALVEVYLVR